MKVRNHVDIIIIGTISIISSLPYYPSNRQTAQLKCKLLDNKGLDHVSQTTKAYNKDRC